MLMFLLVLFCLSVDVFNINKTITNEQSNTNADINRQTKQHQYKHQNIEKKTPMKASTDRKDNINTDINR
jgi:Flp pilus assembly protein TadB